MKPGQSQEGKKGTKRLLFFEKMFEFFSSSSCWGPMQHSSWLLVGSYNNHQYLTDKKGLSWLFVFVLSAWIPCSCHWCYLGNGCEHTVMDGNRLQKGDYCIQNSMCGWDCPRQGKNKKGSRSWGSALCVGTGRCLTTGTGIPVPGGVASETIWFPDWKCCRRSWWSWAGSG